MTHTQRHGQITRTLGHVHVRHAEQPAAEKQRHVLRARLRGLRHRVHRGVVLSSHVDRHRVSRIRAQGRAERVLHLVRERGIRDAVLVRIRHEPQLELINVRLRDLLPNCHADPPRTVVPLQRTIGRCRRDLHRAQRVARVEVREIEVARLEHVVRVLGRRHLAIRRRRRVVHTVHCDDQRRRLLARQIAVGHAVRQRRIGLVPRSQVLEIGPWLEDHRALGPDPDRAAVPSRRAAQRIPARGHDVLPNVVRGQLRFGRGSGHRMHIQGCAVRTVRVGVVDQHAGAHGDRPELHGVLVRLERAT